MRLRWLVPFLIVLSAACGAPSGPGGGAPGGPPPPIPVKIWPAAGRALANDLRGTGNIEAVDTVDLRVEAQGTVAFVGFVDGQHVNKGDVLVRLRQDAERARLDDALARAKLAEARLSRTSALFDRTNASRQELDQAEAERDVALAARDLAQDGLRRTELRAPFDGVVGARSVSVGATVGPTVPITRIDDLSALFVEVWLPESAIGDVDVGDPADVVVDALPGHPFAGTVSFVASRVDDASRSVSVRVALPVDDALKPGLTAQVTVKASEHANALLVPTQAVVETAMGPALWVVGPDDKAVRSPVTTGARSASTIEVTAGLEAGQRVIVEGLVRLQPGAAVAVVGEVAP